VQGGGRCAGGVWQWWVVCGRWRWAWEGVQHMRVVNESKNKIQEERRTQQLPES